MQESEGKLGGASGGATAQKSEFKSKALTGEVRVQLYVWESSA